MTTTNTYRVDPNAAAGGDGTTAALSGAHCAFQSAAIWEAARQADISTATGSDCIERAVCSSDDAGSTHAEDTTALTIDGWTTDATGYIQIESASSYGDKWNASIYRLHVTVSNGAAINVSETDVKFIGLQVWFTQSAGSAYSRGFMFYAMLLGHLFDKCIIRATWGAANEGSSNAAIMFYDTLPNGLCTIRNCLIYDFINGTATPWAIYSYGGTGTIINVENCTIYNCYGGITNTFATMYAKNVGVAECGTAFAGTITQTTCSTDTPTFVDEDNDDFHLDATDTTWTSQGTDLSGTFTDDIDGDVRSLWSIGCDDGYVPPASQQWYGEAHLMGAGSITADGFADRFGAAALRGIGSLAAAGIKNAIGRAHLVGIGSLSADGFKQAVAACHLLGVGTFTGDGFKDTFGAAALSGTGILVANGYAIRFGAADLRGIGALQAAGYRVQFSGAALLGEGIITAEGIKTAMGICHLLGIGTLHAIPGAARKYGAAHLLGEGVLEATGFASRYGAAALLGIGTLEATGEKLFLLATVGARGATFTVGPRESTFTPER